MPECPQKNHSFAPSPAIHRMTKPLPRRICWIPARKRSKRVKAAPFHLTFAIRTARLALKYQEKLHAITATRACLPHHSGWTLKGLRDKAWVYGIPPDWSFIWKVTPMTMSAKAWQEAKLWYTPLPPRLSKAKRTPLLAILACTVQRADHSLRQAQRVNASVYETPALMQSLKVSVPMAVNIWPVASSPFWGVPVLTLARAWPAAWLLSWTVNTHLRSGATTNSSPYIVSIRLKQPLTGIFCTNKSSSLSTKPKAYGVEKF